MRAIIELCRCGALHCGDQLNGIDQKSFTGISLTEANAVLRSCIGDFCRIEVTPVSTLAAMNIIVDPSQTQQNRGEMKEAVPIAHALFSSPSFHQ